MCFYQYRPPSEVLEEVSITGTELRYVPVAEGERIAARFETGANWFIFVVVGKAATDELGRLLGCLRDLRDEQVESESVSPGEAASEAQQLTRLEELRQMGLLTDLDYTIHRSRIVDTSP